MLKFNNVKLSPKWLYQFHPHQQLLTTPGYCQSFLFLASAECEKFFCGKTANIKPAILTVFKCTSQ